MTWRTATTWVLLVAAILSGWMAWRQRSPESGPVKAQFRPDYVLSDLELIALDDQGREAFTLRAPRLTRDPTAKSMDIQTPLFVIPPRPGQAGTPWQVRSATAWVAPKGDEIRLRGQVKADSQDAQGQPVNISTEELNVFPNTKRATSAVRVSMTRPGFILNGRGLDAQLDAKRIVLQSDVKARYERTAR